MSLHDLARHHGLTLAYEGRPVPDATLRLLLRDLGVDPVGTPEGPPAATEMRVPEDGRCFLPQSLRDAPGWGVFGQLYELRSARNWGIGDFADLAVLARTCGAAGADFLGINPVHALFTAEPRHTSPFSPSNRRFLNPLYIAPDLLGCPRPEGLPDGDEVDYVAVAKAKLAALRAAFDAAAESADFDAFRAREGEALRLHALFETLSYRFGGGWLGWPEAFHRPDAPEVREHAEAHEDDIRFHEWLQWIARTQLAAAQRAAEGSGMRLGLYLDLAVGEALDGSATWSGTAHALEGVTVGAPPDVFSEDGQNWQLAAPSPRGGHGDFDAMIEAQLRDAGALRIDHAMALWQLFLIPKGEPAANGTHLRYPMEALLRTLAARSNGSGAVVIGEDLGWVPEGFRDAMAEANVLAYRIVYFEQDERGFHGPDAYPRTAMACLSTHDLPPLAGWWRGDDIRLRAENGLISEGAAAQQREHRVWERRELAKAMGADVDAAADALPEAMLDAAHRFIAATPCLLAGVRLADLVGPDRPTNMPGTTDGYPNWRPRAPVAVDDVADHPTFRRITALMRDARPRPNA
ncbi:4-alpha-glucanotransferase [Jannaschia sp. W003]|uniref:4-alpha-glucanotransferase n=1 Tax=Jannaschia sp. W003 TaxID=2867012 RepID=UPI0021A4F0D9|nr:4-alpha-glucanotransferase [Jannaschia sp. W003]UWQ21753.1 4-alpha-glucanotransferase [Jannaschia sp. W003]